MRGRGLVVAGAVGVTLLLGACGGVESKKASPSSSGEVARSSAPAQGAAQGGAMNATVIDSAAKPADGSGAASSAVAPASERKIVQNVFLDLQMRDVQAGFEWIGTVAEAAGGLVSESNVRFDGGERRASITIRVPSARLQDVLAQVRGLATSVDAERSNANDVTEEYTDLGARQRTLEATEQQLLVFLTRAQTIQETLQVQDRLNTVRTDIERVKGRLALLTRLTDLSTVQIQLRPTAVAKAEPRSEHGPAAAVRRGWNASLDVVGGIGTAALTLAAFSWWLLPFAALGVWATRRGARRRPVPAPAAPVGGGGGE